MKFESNIDELATDHDSAKKKKRNNQHPEGMAAISLIEFMSKKRRKTRDVRDEAMASHEPTHIKDSSLKSHGHPDDNIGRFVMRNRFISVEHILLLLHHVAFVK